VSSSAKNSSSSEAIAKGNWLTDSLNNRGFFKGWIELPKDNFPWPVALGAILLAYLLSFWVRLEWIDFAQAHFTNEQGEVEFIRPNMVQDGVALANTHDSFYFGTIVQKAAFGRHQNNSLIPDVYQNGMITALPYWLIQAFPSLTVEQLLLWLPVFVAGLVCIPIVLIGRLYGSTIWGFYAACLAGVTHSYYNRTLAGYYDTDIFSITSPAFSVFLLLSASRKNSIGYLTAATLSLLSGNFFYGSVQAVTCSLCVAFVVYRLVLFFLDWKFSRTNQSFGTAENPSSRHFVLLTVLNMSWVLFAEGWSLGSSISADFPQFCFGLSVPVVLYFLARLSRKKAKSPSSPFGLSLSVWIDKTFTISSAVVIVLLILGLVPLFQVGPLGNTWMKITGKLHSYSVIGKSGATLSSENAYSLKFLDVTTTIREASEIPPEVVRNRILADTPICSCPRCMPTGVANAQFLIPAALLGLAGTLFMMFRYWELCLTFPFLAIAYYCFKGSVGLRFTVHVGNYASLGLVFLIITLLWGGLLWWKKSYQSSNLWLGRARYASWILTGLLVCWFAMPNLNHAAKYHSHVVYPIKAMEVLEQLNDASDPDDFVVTWWDYGSGCWFYGDTCTFTSPAHQTFDNFLSSEILRSTSQQKAVNLSRLKTETFVNLVNAKNRGEKTEYSTAVQSIFRDGQGDQPLYQSILADAENADYPLPSKSRDTFIYLPYEILRIFPTILSFSSRNLYFPGNEGSNAPGLNEPPMMILRGGHREGGAYVFENGYRIDRRGYLIVDSQNQGAISYGQAYEVDEKGGPAKIIQALDIDGLSIPLRNDATIGRRILFLPQRGDLVILSADTFRSSFARRFLLNQFDANAYSHPSFALGANPRKQPFFTQADWVTSQGSKIFLNMRGGYKIEADLSSLSAKLPNAGEALPFSFHRKLHHEKTGELIEIPSQKNPNARFHLIQTTIPTFLGDRDYIVPKGGKTLGEIAKNFALKEALLSSYSGFSKDHNFEQGDKLQIPGKGYQLGQAWFFMDQEAFDSLLVQGYFMENLDPNFFEKVYCTSWGKVYKILSN